MNTLNEIADQVHAIAKDKGWYDIEKTRDHFIESMCNNLHNEVSELHEAWRNGQLDQLCDKCERMSHLGMVPLTCLEEEMADIIIRVLDSARHLGVDIQRAIEAKSSYNETRLHRHGNKKS